MVLRKLPHLSLILFVLFLFTTYLVSRFYTFGIDLKITNELQEDRSGLLTYLMSAVSSFGNWYAIPIIILGIFIILTKSGMLLDAIYLATSSAVGVLISSIIKIIVGRPRPALDLVQYVYKDQIDNSFPSGHVTLYTILFGYLVYLSYTRAKHLPDSFKVIMYLLIISVGVSRIYLGAHWFSDVLGGYLLGGFVLARTIEIRQKHT